MNDAALIVEAKKYLDGYHIDLSKYAAVVERDEDDITAVIEFTSKSGCVVGLMNCYYDETGILQASPYINF